MRLILFFAATLAYGGTPKVASDTTVVVFVEGHEDLPGSRWFDVRSLVTSIFKRINVRIEWEYGKPSTELRADRFPVLLHVATVGPVGNGNPGPTCNLRKKTPTFRRTFDAASRKELVLFWSLDCFSREGVCG